MNNKILFLFILILTLSFSCAFAYTSDEVLAQLTILKNKGVISGLPTDYNNNSAWASFTGQLTDSRTTGYSIIVTGSNNNYYDNVVSLYCPQSTTIINNRNYPQEWASYRNNNNFLFMYNFHNDMSNWSSGTLQCNKYNIVYAYTTVDINTTVLQLSAGQEYGGSYLNGPTFEYDPYDINGYITVYGSGESAQFIRRPFSYSNMETRLGYITNIDDYYYLEGKFGPFVTPSIVDSQYGFIKNNVGTYNGKLVLNVNGEILINTAKLVNNQGYSLYFIYKMSPDDDYHYSDYYYYYTYKYGTNPVSR